MTTHFILTTILALYLSGGMVTALSVHRQARIQRRMQVLGTPLIIKLIGFVVITLVYPLLFISWGNK